MHSGTSPRLSVHQIYYSRQTHAALDPGFIPLDNLDNPRPDWREYWPIRRFLQSNALADDTYYGFLSPKFGAKTRLTSQAVALLTNALGGDYDVVSLSPFCDQACYYRNVFENGDSYHPGMIATTEAFLQQCGRPAKLAELVNTTQDTVFCNYFLAKPAFWAQWLNLAEQLFDIAENGRTPLAEALRKEVPYDRGHVHMKVFVIERLCSFLLLEDRRWKVGSGDPFSFPVALPSLSGKIRQFVVLDALKQAFVGTRNASYLEAYYRLRDGWFTNYRVG